jgi:hypothetical protein
VVGGGWRVGGEGRGLVERKVKKKWKCTDSVEMEEAYHGSLLPEGEGSDTRLQELVYDRVQLRLIETVAALDEADGLLERPALLHSHKREL